MRPVSRCLAWVEKLAWWWERLGFATGRPTPSKGHRVHENLPKLPQLAPASQTCTLSPFPSSINDGTFPLSIHRSNPCVCTTNPEIALVVSLPTASPGQNVQIASVHCRFFSPVCLPVGGRDDDGFFRSSEGISFTRSEFLLKGYFLSGSLFPWNSVVESCTVANHSLPEGGLMLSIARNLHCFFFPLPLDSPLAAAVPEAGFSSCLSREETCFLINFSDPSSGPPSFSLWCSLTIHLSNNILNSQRQQWI